MERTKLVTRRRFLAATVGLAGGVLAIAACSPAVPATAPSAGATQAPAAAAPTKAPAAASAGAAGKIGGNLNFISWEGYDDKDAAKPFYDKYGATLNATYIGSNDDILTKYKAGGSGKYDIGAINNRYFQPMIDQKMIIPLDLDRIPNYQDLFPQFRDPKVVPWAFQDGKVYGIPSYFGFAVINYNADKVKTPPMSWDALLDPQYQGKVGFYDNAMATMLFIGIHLGFGGDGSKYTKDQLKQIVDWGKKFKANSKTIVKSYGEMTDLLVRGDIWLGAEGWEYVTVKGKKAGANLAHTIPDGPVKPWCDSYFIFNGAPNQDTAYAWINHMVSPEAMSISGPNVSALVTNTKSVPLLPQDFVEAMGFSNVDKELGRAAWTILPSPKPDDPNLVSLDDVTHAYEEIKAS